ncbi:MAG: hypothetical protein PHI06_12495 [Desulfobulbaceae bacterium]|nr:hypothetical protein [Desulfobulbaceae bacterium]
MKQEQGRTREKKQVFIGIFKRTLGSIKASCEKTGIDRATYYRWLKDPVFEAEVKQAWQERLEDVEQIANNLILAGNPAMVRHFLDRRHPDYMPRAKVEGPKPGEQSFEQVLAGIDIIDDNQKAKIEPIAQNG